METEFRAQAEKLLNSMDIPQREEFEAARDMAAKARAENVTLAARLDALEARIAALEGGGTPKPATRKPAAKK